MDEKFNSIITIHMIKINDHKQEEILKGNHKYEEILMNRKKFCGGP